MNKNIIKFLIIIGVLTILGAGCEITKFFQEGSPQINAPDDFEIKSMGQKERVQFKTTDGVLIIGEYQSPEKPKAFALLLHMMPADRTSWYAFMDSLKENNFASLAIDLRGHGESLNQGGNILNYHNFSNADHQASIKDVEAAVDWLIKEKSARKSDIFLTGASIGANLALQYQSQNSEIKAAILLSPGLDYRGVKTEPSALKIIATQAVFLVASEDDDYSLQTNRVLYNALQGQKEIKELKNAGHGTTMLEREPVLMDEVIEWLKQNYK